MELQIHIESMSSEDHINLTKFAVQDSVFRQVGILETGSSKILIFFVVLSHVLMQEQVGELGAWNDDEGEEGGWEEQGDLLTDSQHALRIKRENEREKRRKVQEALRGQQRTNSGASSLRLGTRIT